MRKTPTRILLLKGNPDFDAVLDDFDSLEVKSFPEKNARFYWKLPPAHTPRWVKNIFPGDTQLHDELSTRSASAVLLVKRDGRVFAVTFGFGKSLLKHALIESRFGLKVVLNRVNAENLRSIDTKSLDGFLSQTREQVPSLSPMSSFGIDIEKDFIKTVTGSSNDELIGKTITGTDSFYASMEINLDTLPAILDKLVVAYEDNAYKDNFEFVDNITEVPKSLVAQLDEQLVSSIVEDNRDRIWLAPPDILDWGNHGGFTFKRSGGAYIYDDISIATYLQEKVPVLEDLTVANLRAHKIIQLTADYTYEAMKWSVYTCLYAEIEFDSKRYILSDGKWFEVNEDYVNRVKDYLTQNLDVWLGEAFSNYESGRMATPDENGLKGEALYNLELAGARLFTLMDAKMIVHGGANSKIELSDLYKENLFIHVKRYTRSSGLSHLFNQGKVSAELICSDKDFRIKAAAKIIEQDGTTNISEVRPDMQQVHVVFGVVSAASGELNLPFFSQVALKNAVYFLKNTLNVGKVSLVKIQAVE